VERALCRAGALVVPGEKNDKHSEVLRDGARYHLSGDLAQAEKAYRRVLQSEPNNSEARHLLSVVASQTGRFTEALQELDKAIALNPENSQFHNSAGQVLLAQGHAREACRAFQKALALNHDYAEAHHNLGLAHYSLDHFQAAARHQQLAILLRPQFLEALVHLGHVLIRLYRPAEAIEKCRRALQIQPDAPFAHLYLSTALRASGQYAAAIKHSRTALRLSPKLRTAHTHHAILLLQQGKLRKGFKEYDWRYAGHEGERRWSGKGFVGKKLLVFDEQGLGDVLQFVRYLPQVKKLGGSVIFETRPSLFGLLRDFPGIDQLTEWDAMPPGACDLGISLMSLPKILGTTLATIPNSVPYLHADANKVAYWRRRLAGPSVKVGLVWAGNPKSELDGVRSCKLAEFRPLFGVSGVRFYSLQYGRAMNQIDALPRGIQVVNLGKELPDFSDVAAAVDNLDLVISVDTAMVHLAGAMAKPVFTMLGSDPDWRWMLNRNDSPWYPTMRLFRQKQRGEWPAVFSEAGHALREFVSARRPRNFTYRSKSPG